MGLIRGGALVIVVVLFFVSLLTMNTFLTLSLSLEHDEVVEEIEPIVTDLIENNTDIPENIDSSLPLMEEVCKDSSEFVFNDPETGNTFEIPCETVDEGSEAVLESAVEEFIEDSYYKEYDCGLVDCLQEQGNELYIVSEDSKEYWNSKFLITLVVVVILGILVILLAEKKSNGFIVLGALAIVSSLPFTKIEAFLSFLFGIFLNFIGEIGGLLGKNTFLLIFSILFNQANRVFFIMFFTGLVLILFGVLLKFFNVGFKISGFFQRASNARKAEKFDKIQKTNKTKQGSKSQSLLVKNSKLVSKKK